MSAASMISKGPQQWLAMACKMHIECNQQVSLTASRMEIMPR